MQNFNRILRLKDKGGTMEAPHCESEGEFASKSDFVYEQKWR